MAKTIGIALIAFILGGLAFALFKSDVLKPKSELASAMDSAEEAMEKAKEAVDEAVTELDEELSR